MLLAVATLVRPNMIQIIKNRTTVICFKFKVDEKPVLVMPLQSEGYPEASSNWDDQLKWTLEIRLLEIRTSTCFINSLLTWLQSYWSFPSPLAPLSKKYVLHFKSSIFSPTTTIKKNKLISKKILPFWLHHRVSSINVIIGSFPLNFNHKQFISSKKEINFLNLTDLSTETLKIQVIKGLSSNKMNQY